MEKKLAKQGRCRLGRCKNMSFLTVNIKELREKWMKFYLNIMALKSHNVEAKKLCEEIQNESALYNEKIMDFFEKMEKSQ